MVSPGNDTSRILENGYIQIYIQRKIVTGQKKESVIHLGANYFLNDIFKKFPLKKENITRDLVSEWEFLQGNSYHCRETES